MKKFYSALISLILLFNFIIVPQAYALNNSVAGYTKLADKVNVSLEGSFNVYMPINVTDTSIESVHLLNNTTLTPIDMKLKDQRNLTITPTVPLLTKTKYVLKITLTNGKKYYVNITTTSAYRNADKEPNDNRNPSSFIGIYETVVGTFTPKASYYNDEDYYKIVVPTEGYLTINVINLNNSPTKLRLYNENLTYYTYTDYNETNNELLTNALEPGTYYINVASSQTSKYLIKTSFKGPDAKFPNDKENNDIYVKALPLSLNSKVTGHIGFYRNSLDMDKQDWYKIVLPSDGILNLSLLNNDDEDMSLLIYGNKGEATGSIVSNQYSSKSAVDISAPLQKGTYYIKVAGDDFSTYTLQNSFTSKSSAADVENNNTYLKAQNISFNQVQNGRIGYFNENALQDTDDWYKLTLTDMSEVTIEFNSDDLTYSSLYLYGSKGNNDSSIAYDAFDKKSYRSITKTLKPGTYYINIHSDTSLQYTLSVKK